MTCGCGGACCSDQTHFATNLAGAFEYRTWKNQTYLVAPVVMLRETVVNGALVTHEHLKPEAWNGTPVTVNHPSNGRGSVTANSPETLEQFQVGFIFNSKKDRDKLKGEAWINVADAERIRPGLVQQLMGGQPMDVSTGYFPEAIKQNGVHNGKPYNQIHTHLKPDHLALLPEDTGACSWEDGCGVRTNKGKPTMSDENKTEGAVMALLRSLSLSPKAKAPAANARGNDDDRGQMVADLISNDASPFLPDQMYLLMELDQDTLKSLRDTYLVDNGNEGDEPATNGGSAVTDTTKAGGAAPATNDAAKISDMSVADFTALVANASQEAAKTAVAEALATNKRSDLVAKIVANEAMGLDEDDLAEMSTNALEKLAAKLPAPKTNATRTAAPKGGTNFAGRAIATNADDGSKSAGKYPGMVTNLDDAKKAGKE